MSVQTLQGHTSYILHNHPVSLGELFGKASFVILNLSRALIKKPPVNRAVVTTTAACHTTAQDMQTHSHITKKNAYSTGPVCNMGLPLPSPLVVERENWRDCRIIIIPPDQLG